MKEVFSKLMGKGIKVEEDAIQYLDKIPEDKGDEFLDWVMDNNLSEVKKENIIKFSQIVSFPEEDRFDYIDYSDDIWVECDPQDWVKYFNSRYEKMRDLFSSNLVDGCTKPSNLPESSYDVMVYGLVRDKYISTSGHLMFNLEDPNGDCKVIVLKRKDELMEKAQDIMNDSALVAKGGTSDDGSALFADELYQPSIKTTEDRFGGEGGEIVFTSDWHIGSKEAVYEGIEKLINYVNSSTAVKMVIHLGDLIDNVAVYPDQHKEVEISSIKEQYEIASDYISQIRKAPFVLIPGNHDLGGATNKLPRPALIKNEVTSSVHNLENTRIMSNPAQIVVDGQVRLLLTHGETIQGVLNSYGWNISDKTIAMSMEKLLWHRHLAPEYGLRQVQLTPTREDFLTIDNIPSVIATGHTHIKAKGEYKGVKTLNPGCFQRKTDYMRRMGVEPSKPSFSVLKLNSGDIETIKI